MAKQYGLTVPNKQKQPSVISRPSIFDSDSDSDTESAKPTGLNQTLKRQDRIVQSKAVEEDPTVYQYDEVYDDIENKRNESKLARKDLDRKPKYITKLLAAADRRKRENERRIERQVQKERETEGDEFKDKESFVTSVYRQKLEEIKKLDEEEKREEYLEAIGDVRKQGNLDGFYRHLYDQKVLAEDKEPGKTGEVEIKSEPVAADAPKSPETKKRKYRRRRNSEDSDKETDQQQPIQHLPSNLDADSDFSIDSSDSEDPDPEHKKQSETTIKPQVHTVSTPASNTTSTEMAVVKVKEEKVEEQVEKEEEEEKVVLPKSPQRQPKIDIWKKRTVGEVFDEALRKYFERKALREAGQYVRPCLS